MRRPGWTVYLITQYVALVSGIAVLSCGAWMMDSQAQSGVWGAAWADVGTVTIAAAPSSAAQPASTRRGRRPPDRTEEGMVRWSLRLGRSLGGVWPGMSPGMRSGAPADPQSADRSCGFSVARRLRRTLS